MKIFSLLELQNGANREMACALCRDSEDALRVFRSAFSFLNVAGYAKIKEVTFCIAEKYSPFPISR